MDIQIHTYNYMKNTILTILVLSLGSVPAFSHSGDSLWTFRANTIYVDEIYDVGDDGWGGTAEIGYILNGGHNISQVVGFELGYIYAKSDGNDLDADLIPFFFNLSFAGDYESGIFFEAGAGIGASFVNIDGNDLAPQTDNYDFIFMGQAFGRLGYEFTEDISVTTGLRYWISEEDDSIGGRPFDSFAYELGLKFDF